MHRGRRRGTLIGQSSRKGQAAQPCSVHFADDAYPLASLTLLLPFVQRLGGRSAMLSVHSDHGAPPYELAVLGDTEDHGPGRAAHLSASLAACAETSQRPDLPVGPGTLVRDTESGQHFLVLTSVSRRAHSKIVLSVALPESEVGQTPLLETHLEAGWPLIDGYLRLLQRDRLHLRHLRSLEASLDRLDLGVVIVARNGEVSYHNEAASALFRDSGIIRRRGQQLVGANVASSMMLQASIALAVAANEDALDTSYDEAAAGTLFKLGDAERVLIGVSFPLGLSAVEPLDRAAVLLLLDPSREPDRLVEPICKLHGLSAVETRLACQLVRGQTLTEAALALRIKEQTARSYLKQVFAKLNVRRQTDLVRFLLANVVRSRMSVAAVPSLMRTGMLVL